MAFQLLDSPVGGIKINRETGVVTHTGSDGLLEEDLYLGRLLSRSHRGQKTNKQDEPLHCAHHAGMYLVVPLSLIGIHFVGLPVAGAFVREPALAPAPLLRATEVCRSIA